MAEDHIASPSLLRIGEESEVSKVIQGAGRGAAGDVRGGGGIEEVKGRKKEDGRGAGVLQITAGGRVYGVAGE